MATVTEKVAYLKGMADGMELDTTTKEGKLLAAALDVLEEMAETLTDLEDYVDELTEQVDAIDEDLNDLETDYYDEWDEDDDFCDGDCANCDEDCDGEFFDVTCPSCDTTFCVDEETLLEGGIECPECGEMLEFEIDSADDEDDDDQENDN